MRAFISPDGELIAYTRLVSGPTETLDQLVGFERTSNSERELSPPLGAFVDAVWTQNGAALIYAAYDEQLGTVFTRWERATGRRREVGRYPGRRLALFWALPDESLVTIGADGSTAERLAAGRGAVARRYAVPGGQSLEVMAPAPDGKRAATMGWTAQGDSLVIGLLDLESGTWSELSRVFAEGTGSMRWLSNGTVEYAVTSSVSTSVLYSLDPDRRIIRRLGELSVPFATYNLSIDGKWATAVERQVVADVILVPPG
jgi:hypothetical protein